MKEKKVVTIVSLLIIIVICVVFIILQGTKINSYKEDINSYKEKINKLESQVEDKQEEESKYYDCSFTQTYRVVNLLDGYIAEVPELSYVVLDKYLSHGAFSHIIPSRLKTNLETNKYYEFTYQIKGKGNIKDMNDIYMEISSTELYSQADDKTKNELYKDKELFVYLTIKETDKKGVEQIQENICEGK